MRILKLIMLWLLGIAFIGAGVNHFVRPDFYTKIMPRYLPWHLELVYVSGVAEALLGIMVLIPKFRRLGAWGLIALLIAVFPANIHMALNPQDYSNIPAVLLWVRLPLQFVLIAWAYWFTGGAKE